MPKKCVNGVYSEMTAEEIAEMERMQAEMPAPEPTPEERIATQEAEIAALKEALELLLSGETKEVSVNA